jgi:hypothetical protein
VRVPQIPRLLGEQGLEHGPLGVQGPARPRLGVGGLADRAPRVVQLALQGLDLPEARRGHQQLRQPVALAAEEGHLVVGPRQVAGDGIPRLRGLGQPALDLGRVVLGQLDVGAQGEVAVALGGSPFLGDALAEHAEGVQRGQPALGVAGLGLQALVVLEVGL